MSKPGLLEVKDTDHPLQKQKTAVMMYFTNNGDDSGKKSFVDSSMLLTIEIAVELTKLIPHRIISKGWRMAYSRIRDGASYEK